jgi:tRNA 2-thiouridine synthesizing protein A
VKIPNLGRPLSLSSARHRLDVTGTFCPLPILLAAREMRKLRTGDLLEIVGDDVGILEDMPVWCERAGNRLVEMVEEEGIIRSLVEKGTVPPKR